MKEKDALRERYNQAISQVRASDELLKKTEAISQKKEAGKKTIKTRRALIAAAVIAVLLLLSNVAVFAATGETWVKKLFWHDQKPAQPMENVQDFFEDNYRVFDEISGREASNQYYGGTFLDGGTQVILLTDLSKSSEFTDVPRNVRFEKCDYSYTELTNEINSISDHLEQLKAKSNGYASDVAEWELRDRENRIRVNIYQMNDDKIQWFKENVSDKPFLVFCDTDSFPQED